VSAVATAVCAGPEPVLTATRVSRRYGRRTVIRLVDLELRPATVVGLVGANGAGKSTLLGLLAGHVRPSAGIVQLAAGLRRPSAIGMLPQGARPRADDTPSGLLTFAARLQRLPHPEDAGREALEAVGLSSLGAQRFGTLSEGQRRLAVIAQAFLGSPAIVLLDEPTSALDLWGRRRLRDLVRARCDAGAAIVIASHNLSEVDRLCDELAVIADGAIVARGPMGSLTATRSAVRFDVSGGVIPVEELRRIVCVDAIDLDAGGRSLLIAVREPSAIGPAISDVLALLARHRIDVRRIVRGPDLEQVLSELVVSRQSLQSVARHASPEAEEGSSDAP